jgi:TPR repeat protein
LKDLNKALLFYRQAAAKGHEPAAARLAQIEADLRESDKNQAPPSAQGK